MRLLTVFLIISITYGVKHRGMKTANNVNGPQLKRLLEQIPENVPKDHHVPFADENKEGFHPQRAARLETANDNESPLDTLIQVDGKNISRYYPVPFGHIHKEGFDPLRDPIDMLELRTYHVKGNPLIRQLEPLNMVIPINKSKSYLSPKDEFYFGRKAAEEVKKKTENESIHLNFVGQQLRNVNDNPKNRNPSLGEIIAQRSKINTKKMNSTKDSSNNHKTKFLHNDTFQIQNMFKKKKKDNITWTTCKEFGKKVDFHPKDVVDIEWIPFYVWSGPRTKNRPVVHKFSYPTVKLVNHYKETFGPHLNKSVDWKQPMLLLKNSMEILLIAVGRRGLFDAIPYNEIPEQLLESDIVVPQLQIRLKIVDPYLALMICDQQYAVIMANPGNEPTTYEDIIAEAKTLKFKGRGNPVRRDLENEMWIAQMQREMEIEREKKMKKRPIQNPIQTPRTFY